jgi:hypothetical protein
MCCFCANAVRILNKPGSFYATPVGSDAAINCASPGTLDSGGRAQEYSRPVGTGTLFFIDGVAKSGTSKKVIVTRSVVAVADHGLGKEAEVDDGV